MYKINEILEYLSKCDLFNKKKNKINLVLQCILKIKEHKKYILLVITTLTFIIIFGCTYKFYTHSSWLYLGMLVSYIIFMIAILVPFIIKLAKDILSNFPWKQKLLINFTNEVSNDEKNVNGLLNYTVLELTYAKDWLALKIERIHARIRFFFGQNIAVIVLLGLLYTINMNIDGVERFIKLFSYNIADYNILDWLFVMGFALIIGLVIGALSLRVVANNYTYQLELINLTLKLKKIEAENLNE